MQSGGWRLEQSLKNASVSTGPSGSGSFPSSPHEVSKRTSPEGKLGVQ